MRYIGCLFICLLWLFRATALFAVSNDQKPILIICSYNPAAHQTSVTISDYMEEYSKLGGKRDIIIEKHERKSFSEAPVWSGMMTQFFLNIKGRSIRLQIILWDRKHGRRICRNGIRYR